MEDRSVSASLAPYLSRVAAEWGLEASDALWRELDATCCFVDISGFTALSENLAGKGRTGAGELAEVLNRVLSRLLGIANEKGGSLLKSGGDARLFFAFAGDDHPLFATQAAVAMRAALGEARRLPTSAGRVNLKMSVGIHSGGLHLFRVGNLHRELVVAGPVATSTIRMEQEAEAGEIVVSLDTADRLPARAVGDAKGKGRLLRWRQIDESGPGPSLARDVDPASIEAAIPVGLRARLAERRGESEYRTASVAFVKFEGVDDLFLKSGPDATAVALDSVVSAVQASADAEQVSFFASDVDTNGGKIILVAGVSAGQEDDDEGRVLRSARGVVEQSLPLSIRIGVNRGLVFVGDVGTEYRRMITVIGGTLKVADRLMAAAPPGGILATAGVLERANTIFSTSILKPFRAQDKAAPVQAYRVGAAAGPRQTPYGSLPFLGRDKELARLLGAFTQAREGSGSTVVIEGERGVGKSRLLTEFLNAAAPADTVLSFRGETYGNSVPYLPVRGALRRLLGIEARDRASAGRQLSAALEVLGQGLVPFAPLLAPVFDAVVAPTPESGAVAAEFVGERLASLVVELLELACPGTLLVVAEDAHLFDGTTAAICDLLAKAASLRPWLVCTVRRSDSGGFDPSEAELRLSLGPLDKTTSRRLVEAATEGVPLRPQEIRSVVAKAGGNPLFLEELLRIVHTTDTEPLPDSLEAVAKREIDLLNASSRHVVQLASLFGLTFSARLLFQLLTDEEVDVGGDPLLGLQTQILRGEQGVLHFRHAVLRDAAYQSLPFQTRVRLHRRVAETIALAAQSIDEVAAPLSSHYSAAQDWERTWRYARFAARTAQDARAPSEVVVHLERALTAARRLKKVDPEELANVQADLGATFELLGEYERADFAYGQSVLAMKRDALRQAEVSDRRAFIKSAFLRRSPAAIREIRLALVQLDRARSNEADVDFARAQLLAREAEVRWREGRLVEAVARSELAIGHAEAASNWRALAGALFVLDACLIQMGRGEEATHTNRVLELYEQLGDHLQVAATLLSLANIALLNSKWEMAAEFILRAADASVRAGNLAGAAIADMKLAELRVNQGYLDDAVALLVPARRTLESLGHRQMAAAAAMQLGRARAFLGDVDDGIEFEQFAVTTFDTIGARAESIEARARLAEILVFAGRLDEARTALAQARRIGRASSEDSHQALLDRVELTLAVSSGDRSVPLSKLNRFAQRARETGADYDVLVLLSLAKRLGEDGDSAEVSRLERDLGIAKLAMLPDRDSDSTLRRRATTPSERSNGE